VSDTGDELVSLAHRVDELTGGEASLVSASELSSGTIKGTTEAVTDGKETSNEGRNEVLSGTSGDDGVHRSRNGGSVVGGELENHLEELGGVGGKATLEPEEGDDTSDSDLLREDVRDGHAGVEELLTALVGDGAVVRERVSISKGKKRRKRGK
jgi:hypothetical protein